MIYYVFNDSMAPGQKAYRYSNADTPSRLCTTALRRADRTFTVRDGDIYIGKDRYQGIPELALTEADVAWIMLSAVPLTDSGPY